MTYYDHYTTGNWYQIAQEMKKNDYSRQYPIYIDLTHTPIEVWKSSGHLQVMKYRTINT